MENDNAENIQNNLQTNDNSSDKTGDIKVFLFL